MVAYAVVCYKAQGKTIRANVCVCLYVIPMHRHVPVTVCGTPHIHGLMVVSYGRAVGARGVLGSWDLAAAPTTPRHDVGTVPGGRAAACRRDGGGRWPFLMTPHGADTEEVCLRVWERRRVSKKPLLPRDERL